jgi:fatty-acyl-CoA synthase
MSLVVRDWIEYHAEATPHKRAMFDLASGRDFTYAEMNERVGRVAGFLKSKGIKAGDRVAYLTLNTTDVMELIFGCWRIGAVCLALNFRLTPPELAYILNDAEASLVLVDVPFTAVADATRPQTKVLHWVNTDGVGGDTEYEQGLAAATPIYESHSNEMNDQALLMYSSGTTGSPKGVIITHAMLEFTNSAAVRVEGAGPSNVALNNMPLFHIGGLNVTALPSLWVGGTCVIMRLFDPGATLAALNNPDLNINIMFMVPAAYNAMRAHPDVESTDFSRIEIALCGAEAVPIALMEWWREKGILIQEGYGMTETAAAGCMTRKEDIPAKVGSAGRPLMHTKIKIMSMDGQECGANEQGEIWFKGLSVTPGYWRNEEANKKAFVDGWFRSGDIGRRDEEGYIYIEDRIKDMYISGGENVYPAEIENLLYQMPQIKEVAVVGVKDPKWGETGCVVAAVHKDQTLCLEDVLGHVGDKLAKYKQPQHLHIVDELPRNGTGKVLKFELRQVLPDVLGLN